MRQIDYWTRPDLSITKRRAFLESLKRLPETQQRVTEAIGKFPGIVMGTWESRWYGRDGFKTIPADVWRWAFGTAGFTVNTEPSPLPHEPVYAYRGCTHATRFGSSWTRNLNVAAEFSNKNGAGATHAGNIYAAWLQPQELLAHVHGNRYIKGPYEEWVIDPRELDDERVIPHIVDLINFAEVSAHYAGRGIRYTLK